MTTNPKKIVAILKYSAQVTQDEYAVMEGVKVCTLDTTVEEIDKWVGSFGKVQVISIHLVAEE